MLEIQGMAGHLIRRLNQISVSIFADRMAAAGHDITSVQFAALSAVNAMPGVDQATLAGQIAYDRATIGGVVDRLVQKGLIDRRVSPSDRRARQLRLTEAGMQLVDEITPIVWALQSDILGGLSEEETQQMLTLLRKATDAGNSLSRAPLRG
ncbi:MarR family winged helix-turn-helix transcriptional regulator [Roseibium sp.]|uniref:MarR family winged helix-turn-helix transcriptional regulator n=1 Tax=Roseibium sp. TaxID=1936156 RepID=UPI003A969E71